MRKFLLIFMFLFLFSIQVFAEVPTFPNGDPFPPEYNGENYIIVSRDEYYILLTFTDDTTLSINGDSGWINNVKLYGYNHVTKSYPPVFSGYGKITNERVDYKNGDKIYTSVPLRELEELNSYDVDFSNCLLEFEFVGESVTLPEEVDQIPVMMGRVAGSVISLAALPILILMLGTLLIPRLVHYFRR